MNLLKPFSRLMRYGRSIRCLLAGSPALYILLQYSLFVKGGVEKLVVDVLEAQSLHCIGKSFSSDAFIPEEKDCLLNYADDFFFAGENPGKW